jgi:hypothetical protein
VAKDPPAFCEEAEHIPEDGSDHVVIGSFAPAVVTRTEIEAVAIARIFTVFAADARLFHERKKEGLIELVEIVLITVQDQDRSLQRFQFVERALAQGVVQEFPGICHDEEAAVVIIGAEHPGVDHRGGFTRNHGPHSRIAPQFERDTAAATASKQGDARRIDSGCLREGMHDGADVFDGATGKHILLEGPESCLDHSVARLQHPGHDRIGPQLPLQPILGKFSQAAVYKNDGRAPLVGFRSPPECLGPAAIHGGRRQHLHGTVRFGNHDRLYLRRQRSRSIAFHARRAAGVRTFHGPTVCLGFRQHKESIPVPVGCLEKRKRLSLVAADPTIAVSVKPAEAFV